MYLIKIYILELIIGSISELIIGSIISFYILRCKSVKHNCEIYHNRDKNAVQNMLKIVKSIFNTGKRPEVFCRSC